MAESFRLNLTRQPPEELSASISTVWDRSFGASASSLARSPSSETFFARLRVLQSRLASSRSSRTDSRPLMPCSEALQLARATALQGASSSSRLSCSLGTFVPPLPR